MIKYYDPETARETWYQVDDTNVSEFDTKKARRSKAERLAKA